MSLSDLISKMKRFDKNAEVIFDREEPIGRPTDMVMPHRRWIGFKSDRQTIANSSGKPIRR